MAGQAAREPARPVPPRVESGGGGATPMSQSKPSGSISRPDAPPPQAARLPRGRRGARPARRRARDDGRDRAACSTSPSPTLVPHGRQPRGAGADLRRRRGRAPAGAAAPARAGAATASLRFAEDSPAGFLLLFGGRYPEARQAVRRVENRLARRRCGASARRGDRETRRAARRGAARARRRRRAPRDRGRSPLESLDGRDSAQRHAGESEPCGSGFDAWRKRPRESLTRRRSGPRSAGHTLAGT